MMEMDLEGGSNHDSLGHAVVTLQTVADRAGVSPSTVSRILNGTARVSEAKRERVSQVIEELGFRPNLLARSLAGGKTMSIGVLTQYIDSPFYGAGLRGIEEVLSDHGYIPIVTSGLWERARERDSLWSLVERKVDGLIILTSRLTDQDLQEISERLPIVVTGRDLWGDNLQSLNFDNVFAGKLAAQHLLHLGHRDIAVIIGPSDHKDSEERLAGIVSHASASSLQVDERLITMSDYTERGGHRAMQSIISKNIPFSAVVALNDQMALGAILALGQAGLRVPDDVSVIGMDDLPSAAFFSPPLTSVSQPVYEMGRHAADMLLNVVAGNGVELPRGLSLNPKLVIRDSTRRQY